MSFGISLTDVVVAVVGLVAAVGFIFRRHSPDKGAKPSMTRSGHRLIAPLLAVALLLLTAAPSWAAIAEVGSGSQRANNFCEADAGCDSRSVAFPGNVTSGNKIIVVGWCWRVSGGAPADCGVSDTQGNTYTVVSATVSALAPSGGDFRLFIACAPVSSTGANTVSLNPTGGANDFLGFGIDEVSGVNSCTAETSSAIATGTSTAPSQSLTTNSDGALVIGSYVRRQQAAGTTLTINVGSGYTQIAEGETCCGGGTKPGFQWATEFKVAGTAGSNTVDWSIGTSSDWAVLAASFAATAGGGGGCTCPFRVIGG